MLAHKRRTEHEAILIGRRTALLDNPSLDSRAWIGRNPLRLVIDKEGSLPHTLSIFNKKIPTAIFCTAEAAKRNAKLISQGNNKIGQTSQINFIPLNFKAPIPPQILIKLYEIGIQSLLIEGGTQTLQSFIDSKLWDAAFIEESSLLLKDGIAAPKINGVSIEKAFFGQKIKKITPL